MKLSELIVLLTKQMAEHGDAGVVIAQPVGSMSHDRDIVRVLWNGGAVVIVGDS
jgi:hypothetical protein